MPKPTTYATPICIVLSILAVIGIILGFIYHSPLLVTILLIPAVAYEAYRTEGASTKFASIALLILILAELICIIFKINFDLATWAGSTSAYAVGYYLPLGDIKVIFPVIVIILAIILFFRTIGVYTKWLAIIILVSAVATVYLLDSNIFKELLRMGSFSGYYY